MNKFSYTYDVVRVVDGINRAIATGFETKAEALGLEILATNNVPGRTFKVRQRRHVNPAYATSSHGE